MFGWKNWVTLLVVGTLVCLATGCRKDEKDRESAEGPRRKKVDVRAKNACERTVKKFLDAAAAKNYRLALEYVDVEEMVREGREKAAASTATPPDDVERLKDMLVSMLERSAEQAGELSYEILGSEISGDEAVVEVKAYRDGMLADQGDHALTKKNGKWKLSGSAIRAILPAGKSVLPAKRPR